MRRQGANRATSEAARRRPARTCLSETRGGEELDLLEVGPAVGITGDAHDDPDRLAGKRSDRFLHLWALIRPGRGRVRAHLVRRLEVFVRDRLEPLADV